MKKMLVPLDGSQASEVVMPTAGAIANACGYDMVLFSAWDVGWDAPIRDQERVHDLADRGKEYLGMYLKGVAKEVEQEGIRCDTSVSAGHAAVEILAAITGSPTDLVAMATHGRRATTEARRGSVADKVLRSTAAPVLAVGPVSRSVSEGRKPTTIQRILVPLDGSDDAERGLLFALDLASPLSARVEVFRAVPKLLEEYGPALPEGYLPPIDEARRDEALRYLKDVQNRHPGIAAASVEMGAPRREVPRFIDQSKFDLVVMMSRSVHGQSRWTLGGVADQVIEGPSPVILVPPSED